MQTSQTRKLTRREAGALLLFVFIVLTTGCISLAILFINKERLSKGSKERWCNSNGKCEDRDIPGCQWTADNTNKTPCDYCFGVGITGLFGSLICLMTILLMCCKPVAEAEWLATMAMGGVSIVWFTVAGGYFTKEVLNHRSLPGDGARHKIMGLIWACVCLACVQLIVGLSGLATWKRLHKAEKLQQQQQQQLETIQPPAVGDSTQYGIAPIPPPLLGYPTTATSGNVPLPPPPPSGNPNDAPWQSRGYTLHGMPTRHGAAPLLGGYTNSTAVL